MLVAVFSNRYGPAVVFTVPRGDDGPPENASIPQGPFPRAVSQFLDKGHALTWEQWADHISGKLPYFGEHWSTEQVPDGYTARQALSLVRSREASRNMPRAG